MAEDEKEDSDADREESKEEPGRSSNVNLGSPRSLPQHSQPPSMQGNADINDNQSDIPRVSSTVQAARTRHQ